MCSVDKIVYVENNSCYAEILDAVNHDRKGGG